MNRHVAARRRSDEDQTTKIKEKVGPRRGIMSIYRARRGIIVPVQMCLSESDGTDFS